MLHTSGFQRSCHGRDVDENVERSRYKRCRDLHTGCPTHDISSLRSPHPNSAPRRRVQRLLPFSRRLSRPQQHGNSWSCPCRTHFRCARPLFLAQFKEIWEFLVFMVPWSAMKNTLASVPSSSLAASAFSGPSVTHTCTSLERGGFARGKCARLIPSVTPSGSPFEETVIYRRNLRSLFFVSQSSGLSRRTCRATT